MALEDDDLLLDSGERQPKHTTGCAGAEWDLRRAMARDRRIDYRPLAEAVSGLTAQATMHGAPLVRRVTLLA